MGLNRGLSRGRRRYALLLALPVLVLPALTGLAFPDAIAVGREIYSDNRGRDPVAIGLAGGALRTAASSPSCASCHGEFGEGGTEGGVAAPALTAAQAMQRVAVIAWLRSALVAHKSRDGRTLDLAMPRYRLSDRDLEALADYVMVLPDPPVSGVTSTAMAIAVDTAGASLSPAGMEALNAELNGLASDVAAAGGIFGRTVNFALDPGSGTGLVTGVVTLNWRSRPGDTGLALSVRADGEDSGRCGSLDPLGRARVDTIAAHLKSTGPEPIVIGPDEPAPPAAAIPADAVVVVGADRPDWRDHIGKAQRVVLPIQFAAAAPRDSSHYVAGDIEARSAAARAIMQRREIGSRDAIVVAAYREGAALILTAMREQGRRFTARALCDRISHDSTGAQRVSLIEGNSVTVLPIREN